VEFGHPREEIPKGFRPKAQGCEERATLGKWTAKLTTPTGLRLTKMKGIKEIKRVSNLCLKEQGVDYAGFEWQGGYADFSVSQSNLEQVKEYIARQEEHHLKMTFQANCERCCANTRSNGMNDMFGIETQPGWGCEGARRFSQGSSWLATLGLGTESRWDSQPNAFSPNYHIFRLVLRLIPPLPPKKYQTLGHSRDGYDAKMTIAEKFRLAQAVPFLR